MLFWNEKRMREKRTIKHFIVWISMSPIVLEIFFSFLFFWMKNSSSINIEIYIFRLNSLNRFHSKTIHPHSRDSLLFLINIIFFDEHFLDDDLCSCNFCWLAGLINLCDIFISYTWRLVILFCASTMMLQRMN